mmetsp:Transcript_17026/g.20994  ORF Transcript_17026/g.20994 Transcript_17026/m.20994 type:complete len:88 (+) Transcript_17026:144-407(+)
MADYLEDAKKWVQWDPNSETRAQVEAILSSNDSEELKKAFGSRIAFGTAVSIVSSCLHLVSVMFNVNLDNLLVLINIILYAKPGFAL